MTAYYNENDPFAAAWLRELMRDDLIAPGWVDERSIEDVRPNDLKGFAQCHFFAGIGVWSLALRIAGWPDDRPIWTGSCPCQPFSAAGKGDGFADERHLWPAWFHLISHGKRHDYPLVGEQVASKAGRAWFDLVSGDMGALDHGCGAVDTSAASLGAPFIGQRLYWLASAHRREEGSREIRRSGNSTQSDHREAVELGHDGRLRGLAASCGMGSIDRSELGGTSGEDQGRTEQRQRVWSEPIDGSDDNRLAPTPSGQPRHGYVQSSGQHGQQPQNPSDCNDGGIPLHPVEYWRDADWLLCRDPNGARFRPVEPGTFPLVDARSLRNRLGAVRGAGNALNVSQAACFIEAVTGYLDA